MFMGRKQRPTVKPGSLGRRTNPAGWLRRWCLLLLALCLAPGSAPLGAEPEPKRLRLASLEWAPYVSAGLEQAGWSSFVAKAAAREFGHEAAIEYFPWTRAMQLGTRDPRYAGYFPAYFTEERARSCHFSQPIGSSTVGLAYLKQSPLHWTSLQDLAALRIAVVAGFSNGTEFDTWVREGRLKPDPAPNDMLNLRKLLAGRVDAVVIDKLVLRYLLASDPSLARAGRRIAFHERPLAELALHICFQRTPAGLAIQRSFDAALRRMSLGQLEAEYFLRLENNRRSPE